MAAGPVGISISRWVEPQALFWIDASHLLNGVNRQGVLPKLICRLPVLVSDVPPRRVTAAAHCAQCGGADPDPGSLRQHHGICGTRWK